MTQILSKPAASFLSVVPMGKEFRFYTSENTFIDVSANSLEDFADKLNDVDAASLLFHYPRGDFQAWIKDVVGDNQLADRMCFIRRNISGERLRQDLLQIVQKRIDELSAQ